MLRALLRRLADGALRAELADVRAQLEAEQRRGRVKDAEIESLSALVAATVARIEAVTAGHVRERAEHEGAVDGRRAD